MLYFCSCYNHSAPFVKYPCLTFHARRIAYGVDTSKADLVSLILLSRCMHPRPDLAYHPIVLLHDLICFPRAPAPHIIMQTFRKLHLQSWRFPLQLVCARIFARTYSPDLCGHFEISSGVLGPAFDISILSIDHAGLDVGTDANLAIRPASQAPPRSLLS